MLLLPYPARTVIIFTKIQLTRALPTSGPLQTTFDQYPKRTDSTNYVSTTKHFEHRQLVAGCFVQMETLAALNYHFLTFHHRRGGGCIFAFLLEIIKVFFELVTDSSRDVPR